MLSRTHTRRTTITTVLAVAGGLALVAAAALRPAAQTPVAAAAEPTPKPRPAVSVEPVPADAASTALQNAITPLKGRSVTVTGATGYTASIEIPVPASTRAAVNAAVSAGGAAYYGFYNGANQAVNVQAAGSGGRSGAMTLLVEPRLVMPESETQARNQLAALFPGVKVSLTTVTATPTAYIFSGTSGSTVYSLGIVATDGPPIAFALSGSGTYAPLVPTR